MPVPLTLRAVVFATPAPVIWAVPFPATAVAFPAAAVALAMMEVSAAELLAAPRAEERAAELVTTGTR